MRRVVAVLAAVLLAFSLAGSSLAAGKGRANSFVGNFEMTTYFGNGEVVAHVVADVSEPTAKRLVPGSVAIFWAEGNSVRESHAQVTSAYFWDWVDEVEGREIAVRVYGDLCDYTGPQAGTCQPFCMLFMITPDTSYPNHVGFSAPGSTWCADGPWYDVGKGAFVLHYVGPTPGG